MSHILYYLTYILYFSLNTGYQYHTIYFVLRNLKLKELHVNCIQQFLFCPKEGYRMYSTA